MNLRVIHRSRPRYPLVSGTRRPTRWVPSTKSSLRQSLRRVVMIQTRPGRYLASLISLTNIASEKVDHHQEAQSKVTPSIQVKQNRRRQRERLLRARGGQRRRKRWRWRRGTRGESWRRRGCSHHPKSKLANSAQPPSNQRWVLEMARTQKMVIGE